MTALTIDQEGVKVFTLPEEPVFNCLPEHRYNCKLTACLCSHSQTQHELTLAQAKSSAILVKDQEQAIDLLMENQIGFKAPKGTHARKHFLENIESGKIYPIPALKFRVEKIRHEKFKVAYREVAILSLEEENKVYKGEVEKDEIQWTEIKHPGFIMRHMFNLFNNTTIPEEKKEPVSDGETQEELMEDLWSTLVLSGKEEALNNFTIQRNKSNFVI